MNGDNQAVFHLSIHPPGHPLTGIDVSAEEKPKISTDFIHQAHHSISNSRADHPALRESFQDSKATQSEPSLLRSDSSQSATYTRESSALAQSQSLATTISLGESIDSDMLSISDRSEQVDIFGPGAIESDFLTRVLHRLLEEWAAMGDRRHSPGQHSPIPTVTYSQNSEGSESLDHQVQCQQNLQLYKKNDRDPDESRRPLRPTKRRKLETTVTQRKLFACPFWKKEARKHRDCFSMKLSRIRDVKQHLLRRHTPEFYCQRCFTIFKDRNTLTLHVMGTDRCPSGLGQKLDGISNEQSLALRKKSKREYSESEKWYVSD